MSFQDDIARAMGRLDDMDKAIRRSLDPAAEAAAEIFEQDIKRRTISSRIESGISTRPEEKSRNSATYAVVSTHWLSRIHEYAGTKTPSYKSRRRPFYRPAIDTKQREAARAMEKVVTGSVRRSRR